MPGITSIAFVVAGAIAALGPVLIHLLNHRKPRTMPWAAMEFVREALSKTRRFVRLRDLLLLVLRVAAVLTFALALSRPFLAARQVDADPNQPVHAIIFIDNSLSMSLEEATGTVLNSACLQAKDWMEGLPAGSRISIVPLCGTSEQSHPEAFRTPEDAVEAMGRIAIADRTETAARLIPLVKEALAEAPELKARRVAFFGDQQEAVWPVAAREDVAREIPDLQIVQVASPASENAWVADVRLEEEFADSQRPTEILANIRSVGTAPRKNVAVTLRVDDTTIATQYVDLTPGEPQTVHFQHEFPPNGNEGRIQPIPLTVSLANDHLPLDDSRSLVVPLVASIPIVFVDQFGSQEEDPRLNRLGETYFLRQWLAPRNGRDTVKSGPYAIKHVTIDKLTQSLLQDARVVVVAGVRSPGTASDLLRDYVRQGGQLLIAAGGEFSPDDWSRAAWDEGQGAVPVPLRRELQGRLPGSTTTPAPFFLDPATMTDDVFQISGAAREDLDELYRTPVFFMAAVPREEDASGPQESREAKTTDRSEPRDVETRWLQWRPERALHRRPTESGERDDDTPARVLARFSNGNSFLIERQLGEGTVLLVLSGIGSNWNTLPRTNAVLLLDRLFRQMIGRSLPRSAAETWSSFEIPLTPADRRTQFECLRPDGTRDAVSVEALGPEESGIVLRNLTERGIYRVVRVPDGSTGSKSIAPDASRSDLLFAVNGPAAESDLRSVDIEDLARRFSQGNVLPAGSEGFSHARGDMAQRELWTVFLWCSLGCLLLEMLWLALTSSKTRRAGSPAGG